MVQLQIFADVVCPWCYIGHVRLERALARRPELNVEISWMPFQLNPDMPERGIDRQLYLESKFGGPDRAAQLYAIIEATARKDGLEVDFDRIEVMPNTVMAHRLVRYAADRGLAGVLMDRLFKAYFLEGRDLGVTEELTDLAGEIGLSEPEVRNFLKGSTYLSAIRSADGAARRLGVQAVPCFVFGNRYVIAGAQEPETFQPLFDLLALEQADLAAGPLAPQSVL